jgi:hypothetical protein
MPRLLRNRILRQTSPVPNLTYNFGDIHVNIFHTSVITYLKWAFQLQCYTAETCIFCKSFIRAVFFAHPVLPGFYPERSYLCFTVHIKNIINILALIYKLLNKFYVVRCSLVVEAVCYKQEGREYEEQLSE